MLRKKTRIALPDVLEVKNQKFNGDVTFAANKVVNVSGIETSESGIVCALAGVPAEKIDSVKKTTDQAAELLKNEIFPLFGSSVKILLRLGKRTYIETCTPDADGISRDKEKDLVATGIIMDNKVAGDCEQFSNDVQSAIENPQKHIKYLSIRKMR